MNWGSGESLDASVRWGLSPKPRQMRPIDWLIPDAAAIERVDQVRGIARLLLERLHDHALDVLVRDRARLPGNGSSCKPPRPTAGEAARAAADVLALSLSSAPANSSTLSSLGAEAASGDLVDNSATRVADERRR